MKCVCNTKCQTRNKGGKIRFYNPGQVDDFLECPTHFSPLEDPDYEVDFDTASKDELLGAKWKKSDAAEFIEAKGGKPKNLDKATKSDIVDQILDARFREVD